MRFRTFTFLPLFCLFYMQCTSTLLAEERSVFEDQIKNFELNQHSKLLAEIAAPASSLTPFTSDGCSGGLSVGWQYMAGEISVFESIHGELPPWESCCINHDRMYHSGPSKNDSSSVSFNRRKEADNQLQTCVIEAGKTRSSVLLTEYDITEEELETIYQTIGELMYRAVRLGGMPCTGLPWRWGFGWAGCL